LVGCACFAAFALMFPLTAGRFGLLLLPPMLYELTVAVTFLVRGRARRSLQGAGPRAAAYVATFWMPLVFSVTLRWAPNLVPASTSAALRMAGASLWLFGSVVAFWPVWHLRRSFSIEPAARALRTDGPYRLARHPIYATQILIYSGIFLLRASPVAGLALLVWLAVVRVRIGYEERVLCAEYPEYELYRSRVGAFGPWPRARHAVPAH
jgi:protein-S-isoprenylcysteine O-methyltransferase Ste14